MAENTQIPFNMGYVLRKTAKHVRMYIDVSIRKTFDRVEEFADDQSKSKEILETLGVLHKMRKELDDFQSRYADHFNRW